MDEFLRISDKCFALPVIHGSGDFSVQVRRVMLEERFDCLAVPLPPSFQPAVERAIGWLPSISLVLQHPPLDLPLSFTVPQWKPKLPYGEEDDDEDDDDEEEDDERAWSYVPIDPCQPVIAALRTAIGEHIPREFIDLETTWFESYSGVLPDPYALKQVSLERFSAALLPAIPRVPAGQPERRIARMAHRLRQLERRYSSILCLCSVLDWPWIREAYQRPSGEDEEDEQVGEAIVYQPQQQSLLFLTGELPFVTGLYEQARAELGDDENLSIDGVKELLMAARAAYRAELRGRARRITPQVLKLMLKYIRNLSLIEHRFTPDLYTIVTAAKQVAGDAFALHVAETARNYGPWRDVGLDEVKLGIDQGRLPNGDIVALVSRLPGPPLTWRRCELKPRPEKHNQHQWRMRWNPFSQCSYPPEDELIENFRSHLFDRAQAVIGADLARTEKFTTSVKDGIDIRDTLRHWYAGEIYVKVLPPTRGNLDCAVMLFDSPVDPRDYPWRTTWYAEHDEESTLAFYATDFRQELVGPGIGLARYGGALFLFPPRVIPDIWTNRDLDFAETLEQRLLAAACLHSQSRQIVLLSALAPGAGWRRLAKRFGKSWVHLPLGQFSEATVQQLRMVHVLNGKDVRSYAAKFIRKA